MSEGDSATAAGRAAAGVAAGRVVAVHVAVSEGAPMREVTRVRAIAGSGLAGDRYATGVGRYSGNREVSRDLTLIEAEVIDDLATAGIRLAPGETRRNVTTRGIGLNELVGRRFRVGEVECLGTRLCEPCRYLENLVGQPVLAPLVHRGGLRADIIAGGELRVGDSIVALEG